MGASVQLNTGVNSHGPNEELAVLYSVASACAEASSEDALIESFTWVIARAFYAHNLGVLVVDGASGQLRIHSSYRGIQGKRRKFLINSGQGIAGRVASTGVPLNIHDIAAWEGASPQEQGCFSALTLSVLSVPMKVGERLVGVIHVESSQIGAFVDADERLLVACAGLVATAVERLRAENSERQRAQEMLAIHSISLDITSLLDQQQVLDLIVQKAAEISNTGASGLFTLQADGKFKLVAASGVSQEFIQAVNNRGLSPAGSAVSRAIQLRQPYQIADILAEGSFEAKSLARKQGIRAILALPMFKGERAIGGLVIWNRQPRSFSSSEEAFLQILAQQSVSAIENAQLYEIERQQRKMAQVLYETGAALSSTLRLDEVLDLLLDQLSRLVPYDAANVSLVEGSRTRVIRCRGYEQVDAKFAEIVSSRSFEIATTANLNTMFVSRQPWVIPDTRLDPGWIVVDDRFPVRSWAGAPVVVRGEVVAFFSLDKIDPGFYQTGHLQPLGVFAGQAGLALNNARLYEETRWRALQQEALNRMIAVAVEAPDLSSLLDKGLALVMEALDTQVGGIWVNGYHAMQGIPAQVDLSNPRISNEFAESADETLAIDDWQVRTGRDYDRWKPLVAACELRATLIVPLLARGKRIGILALGARTPRSWSAEEVSLMEAVGRQLGGAVERLDLLSRTQEQARQVQQIVESVPEGVLLLDETKRLILANPVARGYLDNLVGRLDPGLPLLEVGGLPIEQVLFLPPEKPWLEIIIPGPPSRVFELAARPMALEAQLSGWVLVMRDVTVERENMSRLQIQDRLATVGQLAAGIAHDFNNIMAAILVYADLMSMDPGLPNSSRERLGIIQSQIQRATSLIRQILDFSRRAVMEQSQLDLLPFMKELEKLLRRVLPETINISLDYQPGEYLIKADATRLQQALMNLSLNSRDAMPGGGELRFTIDRFILKANDLPPYPDLALGHWICLHVADTGAGIAEEILPRIFDPFFTTKAVGQGTGLGLSQVYGIVKQHGGSIDVSSSPGSGTTFYLYLPALAAPVADQPSAPANGTQRGHGEKVLVVEDDPAAREAIRLLLDNLGYQVRVASNGREALNIYNADQSWTDLVVSDLVMPEMGGVVLFRSLQGHGRGVKFLFITGHPMEAQEQELLQAGGVQWLQKPFTAQELAAGVRLMLD